MTTNTDPSPLATRLLDIIEHDIVPLTRAGVARGDKLFGAAILRKSDLSLVVAGTNRETENPLWHGEVSALNEYYALAEESRPPAADCLFLATHEPCSLCLSAITWTGFDNFHYLFGYEATRDAFAIPHDLRILEEVFKVRDGAYRRRNAFWEAASIGELVTACPTDARTTLLARIDALSTAYNSLSEIYQQTKDRTAIPLA